MVPLGWGCSPILGIWPCIFSPYIVVGVGSRVRAFPLSHFERAQRSDPISSSWRASLKAREVPPGAPFSHVFGERPGDTVLLLEVEVPGPEPARSDGWS